MFFLIIIHAARPIEEIPPSSTLAAAPLALSRYSSRLANGGDSSSWE